MSFPSEWQYKGCYRDTFDRALPHQVNDPVSGNTLTDCASVASTNNARYFGLEYTDGDETRNTGQCFYGDAMKNYGMANNCVKNESGKDVGGAFSMALYQRIGTDDNISAPPPSSTTGTGTGTTTGTGTGIITTTTDEEGNVVITSEDTQNVIVGTEEASEEGTSWWIWIALCVCCCILFLIIVGGGGFYYYKTKMQSGGNVISLDITPFSVGSN